MVSLSGDQWQARNPSMNLLKSKMTVCKSSVKKPCSEDVGPLYKSLGILSLSKRVQIELAKYGHRITHNNIPESLKKLADHNGGTKTH